MGRKVDTLLKGFIAAKCLTVLTLTTSRIKVSRNRKSIAVRQMRGEIAQLLRSGQATHVYDTKIISLMREENAVAVYDLIDNFCLSIISQFPVIETQRYCPPHLKEPIASLIYAAPRCVELPELTEVKDMLTTKYGKEFAAAADEIKPECGVSRQIIELLSWCPATEQMRVKLMKEICLQNNIEWRSEWAILDASSQTVRARVDIRTDIRTAARDEGHQDIHVHPHRGSRHGGSSTFGRDEATKHYVSSSAFGPTLVSNPKEEEAKANIRDTEGIDEPYEHASPGFGPRRGAHPKEAVTRAKTRVSEDYKQEVHEERAEYRMQHHDEISDSGSEVFVYVEDDDMAMPHTEEALRLNAMKSSFHGDAEHHSSNSSLRASSLKASRKTSFSREGSYRRNFLKEGDNSDPLKEDDEFVSTAKAIAAEAARLAVLDYARRRSRSASLSLDPGDLIDGLDSMIEKTVYSKTKVGEDEDDDDNDRDMEFRRDSSFNRPSKTTADHKNDDIHRMEYKFSGKSGGNAAVNHAGALKYEYSSLSSEKEKGDVDSIFDRPSHRRPGEKSQFNYQSQHDSVNVKASFQDASAPTYGHGRNKYDVQGAENPRSNQAEPYDVSGSMPEKSPVFDDSYKESPYRNEYTQETSNQIQQHQLSSRFKEPYFEDKCYREEEPSHPNQMTPQRRRNSYQEENLHNRAQLEQMNANSTTSRHGFIGETTMQSPQGQHMTSKGNNEDKQYVKGRVDRDANMAGLGNHNIRAGPRQRQVTESDNVRHEETAEETTMHRRQGSSPVEWSIKTKEGQDHAMSKMSHRMTHHRSEKSNVDEILSAKWHADDFSATVENMESFERSPSSFKGTESGYAAQNQSHEPVTRNKPLAQHSGKRTPSWQGNREREPDPVPVYMQHGPVDDLGEKVPSSLMSVRQQQQSHREEVQATASGYKPYNRAIREEQKTPAKHHEGDRQHRQGKYQGEQDSWLEKERPQYHGEHKKPTSSSLQKPSSFPSAGHRKHENTDAAGMSPLRVHEPPTRKPPPLPQSNTPIQAGWAKQHPWPQDQRKQGHTNTTVLSEDAGPYERNDSAKIQRRSQPPTRLPPQVTAASTARATDRESPAKLDKELQNTPARPQPPPARNTRPTSSPLASSKSDPVSVASKTPSSSSSSSSSSSAAPAASPTKLAMSISADAPAPATPKGPPKLPHVDDIAANLANLARLAALKQGRA